MSLRNTRKSAKPLQPPSNSSLNRSKPQSFSSHSIKPLFFLSAREKMKYVFLNLSTDETKKLITKSFGKKVILITRKARTSHLCNRSKYFRTLELQGRDESVIPPMLLISKDSFSSYRDRVIVTENIFFERSHYRKLVPAHLKCLSIKEDSDSTLSLARSIVQVQALTLNIAQNLLEDYFKSILKLKLIRRLDLRISRSAVPATTENISEYLINALCKDSLWKANLDLSCQPLSSVFLEQLVKVLNKPKFERWYVNMELTVEKDFLAAEKCTKIFKNVDYLGLETPKKRPRDPPDQYYFHRYDHYLPECDCNPVRIQEILAQSKRALSLTFESSLENLELKPILQKCDCLKSLNLNIRDVNMNYSPGEVKQSKDKMKWTKHLENIIFTSHDEYRDDFVGEDLSLIKEEPYISWNNSVLFSDMLKMIKNAGCCLKYARVYSCGINGGGYGSVHSMINHITDVKTLTSLEHIDLTFSLFYRQPGDLFSKLKNLKKLNLTYYDRSENTFFWDTDIPFQDMRSLTELRVFVGKQEVAIDPEERIEDCYGGGKEFVKNLKKLKKLKVFEINYYDTGISLNMFDGLLKGFCQLKSLRKIILNTRVEKDRVRGSKIEDISEDEVRLKVETIIKKNPSVREFYVKKLRLGSIERIKYLK